MIMTMRGDLCCTDSLLNAFAAKKYLLRGTGVAALVAGITLTIAVLTTEYGIDPTGIGRALGLTSLHAAALAQPQAGMVAAGKPGSQAGSQVAAPGKVRALAVAARQMAAYRTDTW